MYSNEFLEHWGAVYVASGLLEREIPFQEFLENPWGYLKAVELSSTPLCIASGYRPLLPRQRQVAQALWRSWELQTDGDGPAMPSPETSQTRIEEEETEL